jgi:hypothetical protein
MLNWKSNEAGLQSPPSLHQAALLNLIHHEMGKAPVWTDPVFPARQSCNVLFILKHPRADTSRRPMQFKQQHHAEVKALSIGTCR